MAFGSVPIDRILEPPNESVGDFICFVYWGLQVADVLLGGLAVCSGELPPLVTSAFL